MKASECIWCGGHFQESPRGRPGKYCKASCKQRAYESRKWGIGEVWGHFESAYTDCYLCGDLLEWSSPQTLCVDHVIATVHGGRTDVENLRPVHLLCNARKGARLYVTGMRSDETTMGSSVHPLSHIRDESEEADRGN